MTGYFRTALLLAAMTALFLGIGYALGGGQGAVIAFFVALATNAWAWWNSDRMVLSMHNAEPITPDQAPRLFQMVEALSARAGIPMPALYLIHEDQPNAFATGRSPEHAAVAVNTGLLNLLSEQEAAGVIAHELAHIRHRDTLLMTITATLAGAIGMLAQFGFLFGGRNQNGQRNPFGPIGGLLLMVLGPLAAMLVQMAISRSREYEADRGGAEICGDPRALASALLRLEQGAAQTVNYGAEANPATAHMFIVNPLHAGALAGLFRTHPSTEERVARLSMMAGNAGPGPGWGGGGGWGGKPQGRPQGRPQGTPQGKGKPQAPAYPPASPWGGGGQRNPWG